MRRGCMLVVQGSQEKVNIIIVKRVVNMKEKGVYRR